jgi:hypothetical protein
MFFNWQHGPGRGPYKSGQLCTYPAFAFSGPEGAYLDHKMDGDGKILAWPSSKELSWIGSRVGTGAGLDVSLRVSITGHLGRILLLVK